MKTKLYNKGIFYLLFVGLLVPFLGVGCGDGGGGDDANNPVTVNPVSNATGITASITSVSIPNASSTGGPPTVEFTIQDEDGNGVTGFTSARFIIAKLVEAANGESSYWQSYVNTTETVEDGDDGSQAVGSTGVQATYERPVSDTVTTGGTLTDNADGTYTYVFNKDLSAITTANGEALDVTYAPTLVHRVSIQLDGGDTHALRANPSLDFQPSSGDTFALSAQSSSTSRRRIATTTSCNECHNPLAIHGGGRIEVEYCVTCHNPGTTDAHSGNSMDMKVMIHKIHMGEDLPSVDEGGVDYKIWGYRNGEHDYSTVVYPGDVRRCEQCHDPADTDTTPEAGNYASVPTIEACGSCHDGIVFDGSTPADWQTAHTGGTSTNSECASCHGGSGATVDGRISGVHVIDAQVEAAYFQYNITSVTNTGPGESPVVTFSVTNPVDGSTYDILNDNPWTGRGSLSIKIGWDTDDIHNTDSGNDLGQPISTNALTAAVDNGDGTFSVTSGTALPATATGTGIAFIDGHPAADFDGDANYSDTLPVTNAFQYFAITGTASDRREIVDIDKCNQCHGSLNLHGSNRNNVIEVCIACHNPNATDIEVRPATLDDDDDDVYDDFTATGTDGLREQSIDFKTMIHAIHAGDEDEHGFREDGIVVYGYRRSVHDYEEVRYPGDLKDCTACHLEDTYLVPLGDDVLATTMDTGDAAGDLDDPTVDGNISPASAVCASCHDSALAQTHMEQNGGLFDSTQAAITAAASETCAICHGDGKTADVKTAHEISSSSSE